jgi:hypothetical protein
VGQKIRTKVKPLFLQNSSEYKHRTNFVQINIWSHLHDNVFDVLSLHFRDFLQPHCSAFTRDLDPRDFSLCWYFKDGFYQSNPKALEELKSSIERQIFYILTEVIDGVVSNFEMSLGKNSRCEETAHRIYYHKMASDADLNGVCTMSLLSIVLEK